MLTAFESCEQVAEEIGEVCTDASEYRLDWPSSILASNHPPDSQAVDSTTPVMDGVKMVEVRGQV